MSENSEETARAGRGKRGITRRDLCFGLGGAGVLLAMGGLRVVGSAPVVRPPGGQDDDRVVSACVRCQKCYEVCPRAVIAPVHLEDGVLQTRTPKMSFEENYCDFCAEENGGVPLCASVCPTRALHLDAGASAETTVIGTAELNSDNCLAYRGTSCRFCYDACPYDAIVLDEFGRPVIVPEKCTGCGACEAACVSLKEGSLLNGATERAVVVRPVA